MLYPQLGILLSNNNNNKKDSLVIEAIAWVHLKQIVLSGESKIQQLARCDSTQKTALGQKQVTEPGRRLVDALELVCVLTEVFTQT